MRPRRTRLPNRQATPRPGCRLDVIAACLGVALAQTGTMPARADPAVVFDTGLGSALNLGLMRGWGVALDPDEEPQRSPTGILYERGPVVPGKRARTADGWEYGGDIEVGGSGSWGNTSNYFFQRYKDVASGGYVRYFGVTADQESTARFLEGYGGEVGRTDQYYSLTFGRYNAWQVNAFFNEIPTVYTTTYRSLWNGIGTDNVTLSNLTPGGSSTPVDTQANIRGALATTPASSVGIKRKTAGLAFDVILGENWKLYASYTNQKREGARLSGMVFGGADGGGNVDITESIDYNTHDLLAGLRYNDPQTSFNLQVSASLFRNGFDTMTVQNPLSIATFGIVDVSPETFTSARYAQYPDNDYYKVKAEYARALPSLWNGRLTATVAWTRSSQNDNVIAPTALPLTGGTINGLSTTNVWNTTAALLQQTANAEIDATLANVRLVVNPTPALAVTGNVRYYATDNSTAYTACNPLTGQWGRLLNDGSGTAIVDTPAYLAARCNLAAVQALNVAPSTGDINIRSVPFDYRQIVYSLVGDYRLTPKSNLTGSFEQENFDLSNRERDETWEYKFKLGYTNRALKDAVVLLSYEYDSRRGSGYIANPYEAFYSASLGPVPTATGTDTSGWIHTSDALRKLDLADRNQNIVKARLNWTGTPALDAGLTVQYTGISYPDSAFGRNGTNEQTSVGLNVNYQPEAEWGVYASYTWQNAKMYQTGLQSNSCVMGSTYYFFSNGVVDTAPAAPAGTTLVGTTQVSPANWRQVCSTPSALSPLYPTSLTWTNTQSSTNQAFAIGGRYDLAKARLDVNYTYVNGRTQTRYAYNPDAYAFTPDQLALIGNGTPDSVFIQSIVDAGLLVPITDAVAVRLYYHYENGRVTDWHYDGVQQNPVPVSNAVYLDFGPQSYHASLAGLFFRYSF
jgi:MtrB/PioB family decaheme-associated outer membrane protein